MGSKGIRISFVLMLLSAASFGVENISSGKFSVNLIPDFPGVSSYLFDGNAVQLPTGSKVVELNGESFTPSVKLNSISKETAAYTLIFADIGVELTVEAKVSSEALTFTITDVTETADFMVKTIEMPGLVLVEGTASDEAALSNFPKPSYASEKPEDHDIFDRVSNITTERLKSKNSRDQGGVSYAFVSNGKISAGLYSNVLEENLRMIVSVAGEGEDTTLAVAPGKWNWREVSFMTTLPPRVTLVVATDNNDDDKVTWQDAAIAYRRNTPRAYGAGRLKKHPVAHIAMNFGSQATNPFYRVLDNAKKIWLYTDGLGQHIQYKGYQSEGHDSSHPDYGGNVGRRQGGRDALNFVMRRGHDFDVLSGVHINAHEYHKEAKNFSYDIANKDSIGWSWLDDSYLTDYRYDSAFGTLYPRLDAMRTDLPWLDFVYLDVYYGRGWPGWRMHTKINDLGILQFTEFPGVMERGAVWIHVANDWTQAIWGKGDRSDIARFIYYSDKDTFKHDPVLRGTNCDGFMGWHGEQDMLMTIRSAMTVNLPTKYLQHFLLVKQDEKSARFNNGAKVVVEGEISRMYGPDGQLMGSCRYDGPKSRPTENLVFIPWCPTTENKIYHWNDKGGESEWDLPKSWRGKKSALLYRLTDLGRVFEKEVEIDDGKVTLIDIEAATPYVLYKDRPVALPEMEWGEGSLVADSGFDSHSFKYWKTTADAEGVQFANNDYGQTELMMGPAGGKVSQIIRGLEGGNTYAASVWVSIKGKKPTAIAVGPYVPALKMPPINKEAWKVVETSSGSGKAAIDDDTETLWHTAYGKETPEHPHEIVIDFGKLLTLEGFVQTARANMHNGVIKDYKVLVSTDGTSWQTAVKKGTFEYEENRAEVRFPKTFDARYFKLVALSEHKDGPWATLAELDMIGTAAGDVANEQILTIGKMIDRTSLTNFTDQSSKYMSNWHRIKVLFDVPVGVDAAELVLAADALEDTAVYFDDVRVVKSGRSVPGKSAKNVVLFEDFENVDEGWGPFMYGWKGPMNTHLSEANLPYTDDTISGEFSLKTRSENHTGIIYRTVPATLALKANTKYHVSFEYLSDTPDRYTFVAGSNDAGMDAIAKLDLKEGDWTRTKATMEFTTGNQSDWFVGVHKNSNDKGLLVIDNILIEKSR